MPSIETDNEVQAIQGVISALSLVDNNEARGRVLDYALKRFGLQPSLSSPAPTEQSGASSAEAERQRELPTPPSPHIQDIRTLTERKKPQSAIEMAALVAYYLSELAPEGERKETITSADIEKYFKQASFKLPRAPQQTLLNAKAAGYFDSVAGGQYNLNPVGYNLVVHNLPGDVPTTSGKTRSVRARRSKPVSSRTRKSGQAKTSRQRGV